MIMTTLETDTGKKMSEKIRFITKKEKILTLIALFAGGISPLLVVFASAKIIPMPLLFWGIDIPGMLLLTGIFLYSKQAGLNRLYHRLLIGIIGGILLTMALDVVRVAGVHLGYLGDSVSLFGRMIDGEGMKADLTPLNYSLGALYHFFNGISFGVLYSIVFGRTRWWGPVLFSVFFVELGMMTLPPMAKMMGPFGIDKFGTIWNGMFIDTLLAHAAMGVTFGIINQKWGRDKGVLFRGADKG
jgi:hypothetical protein